MKRLLVTVISVLLIVAFSAFTFTSCKKEDYVSFTMMIGESGTFKILQLTDMHFINSEKTDKDPARNLTNRDKWAKQAVTEIVNTAKPDMIIVTGDTTFTLPSVKSITGTEDNYAAFREFALFVDSFKIPWAFLFGNHDEEGSLNKAYHGDSEKVKKKLGEYLNSNEIKYCKFAMGPDDINGVGNYIINVVNKDGDTVMPLVLFDSGSYLKVVEADGKSYEMQRYYEWVHDDQLDWYEAAIKDISRKAKRKVDSIVFQHIPFPTYQTVINAAVDALGENWQDTINVNWEYGKELTLDTSIGELTYHGGICEEADHEVCCSYVGEFRGRYYDGGHEFERLLKVGSTKYVFCGHDHRNTFSFTYKGIRLSYGMSIDYSANGLIALAPGQNIYKDTNQRGGTLITIDKNGGVDVGQVPFSRNLYQEAVDAANAR